MTAPAGDLEQFQLAEFLAKEQARGPYRAAVFKRAGLVGVERFFETAAVNRGAIVKVTPDMEEAFKWLGLTPQQHRRLRFADHTQR